MRTILFSLIMVLTISILLAQINPKTKYQSGYIKTSSFIYLVGHFKTDVNKTKTVISQLMKIQILILENLTLVQKIIQVVH
jgi:hypothetical protein